MIPIKTDIRVISIFHAAGENHPAPETTSKYLKSALPTALDGVPGVEVTYHFYDPNQAADLGDIITFQTEAITHIGVPVTHTE